jgi:hypothetical protein
MACMTLFAPMTMATTQLARAIHDVDVSFCEPELSVERNPLRMSWVVTTDEQGYQRLKMTWESS